jgi:sulfur relay (sulfurtransferase) DsrC/TusE family protein
MTMLSFEGKEIETDSEGYLKEASGAKRWRK